MSETQTQTDRRCSTQTNVVRADRLRLGDQVLLLTWRGGAEVATVTSLALVGDDVEMNFSERTGELSTSVGNTFQVVSER
jgi:hypothetical protein